MSQSNQIVLLEDEAVSATTKKNFILNKNMVPATISCRGVAASGEDITLQKLVSSDYVNDAVDGDFVDVVDDGLTRVLNGNNQTLSIFSPGVFRIKTANTNYASGSVTVVVDY